MPSLSVSIWICSTHALADFGLHHLLSVCLGNILTISHLKS
jgi:hypothetical protein